MKATLKGRYEGDKATAATTLAAPAGDLRFKASATEAAFANGPSLRGLTLTLEKPGAFLVDLKPHNQDVRFQFMNSALVLDKRVSLTYTHSTSFAPAPAPPAPSRPIRAPAAVFIALAAFGSASFSPKSSVESTISAHDAVFVSK